MDGEDKSIKLETPLYDFPLWCLESIARKTYFVPMETISKEEFEKRYPKNE